MVGNETMSNRMDGKFRVFLKYEENNEPREMIVVFSDDPQPRTCKVRRNILENIMEKGGYLAVKRWINNKTEAALDQ